MYSIHVNIYCGNIIVEMYIYRQLRLIEDLNVLQLTVPASWPTSAYEVDIQGR